MKTLITIISFFLLNFSFGQSSDSSVKLNDNIGNPIFITRNKVLLTKTTLSKLVERNKIKDIFIPYEVSTTKKLYKELATNGIIIIELKDTTIKTKRISYFLKKICPDRKIKLTDITINGLKISDTKIKYPKWDKLSVDYDSKTNLFNINTK